MPNHEPPSAALPPIDRLREIVRLLRAPGGCPWDIEQTHATLVPNLLEEAYEVAEAIRSGDAEHMNEELGDLLLQAVMHGQIASEAGTFDLDSVAAGICEKLIRRHPHVFADTSDAADTEAVLHQWDAIKREEKSAGGTGLLAGVTTGLPALIRATKLQQKAAKVGFDWPDAAGALDKVREELDEVASADPAGLPGELGDLLFSVVNLARKHGLDAETLLASANEKFVARFAVVERAVGDLEAASLGDMEAAWQDAKKSGT
ncbi:nucleoside triphosphate pyrophosphohydrolase [soil metagenome]